MSDIDTTGDLTATDTTGTKAKAKAAVSQASQALKQEAQTFASAAQEKARTEAQRRAETATKTLGDFANAIRRAGDELAEANQSPAARLIGQAADGLENLSRNLAGKQPEELLDAVRDFGRRHPAAFIGGAVLAGIALGRFVRASEEASGFSSEVGGGAYPLATTDYSGAAGSDDLEVGAAGGFASVPTTSMASGLTGAEQLGATGTDAEVQSGVEAATGDDSLAGDGLGDDLGDLTPSDADETSTAPGATGRPGFQGT
ncbi:hypothetical protein [Phenylobacterium sp.]|uniref:hypothetical protein n=1 Tax=Phenylobacterium sp. TaxID=1871053 RepID=UPI00281144E3|nr:hypothetical protein [Phenylobacterium sp.]